MLNLILFTVSLKIKSPHCAPSSISSCNISLWDNTASFSIKFSVEELFGSVIWPTFEIINFTIYKNTFCWENNPISWFIVFLLFRGAQEKFGILWKGLSFLKNLSGFPLLTLGKMLTLNPIALRMVKTPQSFGHSECNRVKHWNHTNYSGLIYAHTDAWLLSFFCQIDDYFVFWQV